MTSVFAMLNRECFRAPEPNGTCDASTRDDRWPNLVFRGRGRSVYFPEHWGPLSIKCVLQGQEVYEINRTRYSITSDKYLVLNTGQHYSSLMDDIVETENLVIFFNPEFVWRTLSDLVTPIDRLLDEPHVHHCQPSVFFEGPYPHNLSVSPLIFELAQRRREGIVTTGWYEEQYHRLLEAILTTHRAVCAEIDRLEAKRASTRVELYRRLYQLRDYLDTSHTEQIRLDDMAAIACLSPNHLLKLFKQVFRVTPHHYLTGRRLETACKLLTTTDLPVTRICLDIGFESPGSFTTLFHQRYGMPPRTYRRIHRARIY